MALAPPAHDRTPLRRLLDAARASDPGWDRARSSLRALVAGGIGAGLAVGALVVLDAGLALAALGAAVGLFGAVTLPPVRPLGRHVVRVGVVAATTAGTAALLGEAEVVRLLVLLVVVAATSTGVRWGPPGTALGLVGFLGYFFAVLFAATPADTAAAAVAALCGSAGLAVAAMVLLPDRPAALLRRVVRALASQLSVLVDAAEVLVAEGPGEGRQRRLRRRLVAVQETALLADTTLDAPAARASVVDPEQLRSDVLVAEALSDHLGWAVLSVPLDTPIAERADLAAALRRARVPAERLDVGQAVAPLVPRLVGTADDRAVEVLERLAAAVERLVHAARPVAGGGPGDDGAAPATTATTEGEPAPRAPVGRLVVQATLSCALALGLGLLVNPAQWYWAVVGAYIVVTTTTSRGAGVRKAVDRVLGTALGVAAGLALATLVAGRATVELAVVVALLFAMFWVFRVSYRWMMVLLTVTVAVLYELTGRLSTEVLAYRLVETALGATVAAVVVFFVLPVRTRRSVDDRVDGLLGALDDVLVAVGEGRALDPAEVRAVDRAVSDLRAATAPLVTTAPTAIGAEVRAARLLATALRVRLGALAVALVGAEPPDAATRQTLAVVRDHLDALRSHLADPTGTAATEPRPLPTTEGPVATVLQAVDDRLAGYGTARGLALRPDPGALAGGTAHPRD